MTVFDPKENPANMDSFFFSSGCFCEGWSGSVFSGLSEGALVKVNPLRENVVPLPESLLLSVTKDEEVMVVGADVLTTVTAADEAVVIELAEEAGLCVATPPRPNLKPTEKQFYKIYSKESKKSYSEE